jgi:hypothetical protein
MKATRWTLSLLVGAACAAAIIGCSSPSSGGDGAETVGLGAQNGALTAGANGSTTYAVTTANVPEGAAGVLNWHSTASLSSTGSKPAWATPSVTAISGNAAVVTMAATASAVAGTYYFSLVEGSAESEVAALVVGAAPAAKSVTVGAQSGVMADGIAGTVTFPVTALNIADAATGTIVWAAGPYDSSTATAPMGVGTTVSELSGGTASVTVTATDAVRGGSYYFRVLEGGTTYSPIKKLAVSSVVLTAQAGTLTSGTSGSATYTAFIKNVSKGTAGTFAWYPDSSGTGSGSATPPTGVTPSIPAVADADSDSETTTIAVDFGAAAGAYYFRLTEGPVRSAVKTLTIGAPKTVAISTAANTIRAGYYDSANYVVATTGFASLTSAAVNWYSDEAGTSSITTPTGLSASAVSLRDDGSSTIYVTSSQPSYIGSYFLRLGVGGVLSNVASLSIVLASPDSYSNHAYNQHTFMRVVWSGVPFATSYDLYRSMSSGIQGTLLTTTTSVMYDDSDVVTPTSGPYYCTIVAKDSSGHVSVPSPQFYGSISP